MRVALGIPYYQTVAPETAYSLLCGIVSHREHDWHICMAGGAGYVDQNREAIVDEALETGAERLIFVDTDIVFSPDALTQLLRHPHAVIGGMYHYKRLPLESVMKLHGPKGGFLTGTVQLTGEPIKCALLPAGFISLHLPTLKKRVPRPWFWFDGPISIQGEDLNFCRAVQKAGLDVWCDPSIRLKHMGTYAY